MLQSKELFVFEIVNRIFAAQQTKHKNTKIMKYTIRVDDKTEAGKKIMEIARRARKGVEIDNPAISGNIPEGYVTGDEMEKRVIAGLKEMYIENGLL